MISIEEYAKRWAKHYKSIIDTLPEWNSSVRCVLKSRIKRLMRCMTTNFPFIFNNLEMKKGPRKITRSVCSGTC